MLPRWHVFYGALFTILIWVISPNINKIYLLLIFLSAVFIDIDHYANAVIKGKKLSLKHAFDYHKRLDEEDKMLIKKGIKKKSDFHLFHTLEFHALVAILSLIWVPFLYIFMGMVSHSLLDLFYLIYKGKTYRREFFLFNWIRSKK